jgi:hypothetical protein
MSIDAMKQAVDTLEVWVNYGNWVWPESAWEQAKQNTVEAIDTLRAAIEQEQGSSNQCGNGAGCLYKTSLIENLEEKLAEAEQRSGNVTFVTLAGKLAALGLVQAEAILDPDGYDGGVQWKAIEKLLRFVKGEDDEH